ncbi:MAG: FIST N-terminal domain-containing protein [Pseudomonadota bacterium]|nr:FIST N-terminal domain-containing protein [Pseudomonadota bacterium]
MSHTPTPTDADTNQSLRIATGSCEGGTSDHAVSKAATEVEDTLETHPDLVVAMISSKYDAEVVAHRLKQRWPKAMIHGLTSCLGAVTEKGFHGKDGDGMALWGISDPKGAYGIGMVDLGPDHDSARQAGSQAIRDAVITAGRPGEVPSLLLLSSPPGREEAIQAGIHDVVGQSVPIVGGSAADNTVSGDWKIFGRDGVNANAVLVGAFFVSGNVGIAVHNGYLPTSMQGRITKSDGRIILEIDNEPASAVYNRWTNGLVSDLLETGGNILSRSTLTPLGHVVDKVNDIPQYLLLHPNQITKEGGVELFANAPQGKMIVLMTGDRKSLINRAERVMESAIQQQKFTSSDIVGALMIYCAGCLLTIDDGINEVAENVGRCLNKRPFLGGFTFGEHSCFIGRGNHFGNLMISAIVFGR